MMTTYELYVFTQESCAPCTRLKEHVQTLMEAEQADCSTLCLVKTASGERTALAEEQSMDVTPTLVVVHAEVAVKTR